ncbi:MAG TPA: hypothetical protein VMZ30_11655 [Pyrinomonadaceae bacterium]|nr:hypothetical protein [Pyrinomonadaceae bacterium]
MATPEKNRSVKRAAILLGVLVALGGVLLWWLLTRDPTDPRSRVVAKRDLPALRLLTNADLEMRGSPELSNSAIEELTNRHLLVGVKQGGEVTREMVAPSESKQLLADAIAVAIPMSATTSLAGQLHAGDMVDLVTVPKGGTQAKTFENLMVLSIAPANKDANAITLAIPRTQRDDFALAVTGGELVLTRRIIVANQQSK